MLRHLLVSLSPCLLVLASAAHAQTTWPAPDPVPPHPTGATIPLSPSAPQPPDLQYQLLPRSIDLDSGNAALAYANAAADIPPDRPADKSDTIDPLRNSTLADFDEAAAKSLLDKYDKALHELHHAARFDHVDWQTGLRTQGANALFPSLQSIRSLANVLQVSIRLHLKHHDFPAAIDDLRTGFALASHLGQGDTIIHQLVGAAVANQMSHELEEWIGIPNSPNLFWPIAYLPRPFLHFSIAAATEKDSAYVSIPELRDMRSHTLSTDGWVTFVHQFQNASAGLADSVNQAPDWQLHAQASALALLMYPDAKRFLLSHGHSQAEIDQMPVAEALGKYFPDSFDASADEVYKCLNLPPCQAIPALKNAEAELQHPSTTPYTNLLARIFLPSLSRAIFAAAAPDRTLDALQTIEALRAYDADHPALPDSLNQLPLPLPIDPITGKSFTYTHSGNTATLTSTPPPSFQPAPRDTLQYTLTTIP